MSVKAIAKSALAEIAAIESQGDGAPWPLWRAVDEYLAELGILKAVEALDAPLAETVGAMIAAAEQA